MNSGLPFYALLRHDPANPDPVWVAGCGSSHEALDDCLRDSLAFDVGGNDACYEIFEHYTLDEVKQLVEEGDVWYEIVETNHYVRREA